MDRVSGETGGRHGLDVLAHRGLGAANHPDQRGQNRQRAARPLEDAITGQPAPRVGDELGDRPRPDRCHLVRGEMHLAPVVGPLEAADDGDPLPGDRPGPPGVDGRHLDVDLGYPVPQREEQPAAPRHRRPVHLPLDRDAPDATERPGDLAGQADQRHPAGRTRGIVVEKRKGHHRPG